MIIFPIRPISEPAPIAPTATPPNYISTSILITPSGLSRLNFVDRLDDPSRDRARAGFPGTTAECPFLAFSIIHRWHAAFNDCRYLARSTEILTCPAQHLTNLDSFCLNRDLTFLLNNYFTSYPSMRHPKHSFCLRNPLPLTIRHNPNPNPNPSHHRQPFIQHIS